MIVVRWSFAPPSGISLFEHIQALPLMMLKAYAEAGYDGVYVTSPEVAAIVEMTPAFMGEPYDPGPLMLIGSIRGVQLWVNADFIVANEVMVVDRPDELYSKAKVVIEGLTEEETVLDYLARI